LIIPNYMKRKIFWIIFIFVGLVFLYYLYVVLPKNNMIEQDNIQIITCFDNQHTYAVYLPKSYKKANKGYRVLFCFDPSGNGKGAVRKFIYAGDKYEWIVVGSLDAKNGPTEPIFKAQDAMLKDIPQKYTVDTTHYYATGFSGGARMAYDIAYRHPEYFKAVIACGAGFGLDTKNINIAVYHCIGNEDFNLDEVKDAYNQLKYLKINTRLNVFPGGHRWPPPDVINGAIDWVAALS
jgi:predicted esterase